MIILFFPDPVLEEAVCDIPQNEDKGTGVICSHCHMEIKGTVHRYGNQFFDPYCWNLRFILGIGKDEEHRKEHLRKYLGSKGLLED